MLWNIDTISLLGRGSNRLTDITAVISEGITAVTGESGSGKTSFLNLLAGFEKPDSGRIIFHSQTDTRSIPLYWVPQDGGLWPGMTAYAHLSVVSGRSKKDIREMLACFDLEGCMSSCPEQMSKGECSRLSVARALMTDAPVLVMDEPLVHVDKNRAGIYWNRIFTHIRQAGISLVFSTHNPESVIGEAERVICLREGKMLYKGDTGTLYLHPDTPEIAACLGEFNWFSGDEYPVWIGTGSEDHDRSSCIRPEHLEILEDNSGPLKVESSRFRGSIADTVLVHEENGKKRTFFHRPPKPDLSSGMRVSIRILCMLMLVIWFGQGCRDGSSRDIEFAEESHWMLSPYRSSIPAPRAVCTGPEGTVYVLDTAGRICVFDLSGNLKKTWRMPEYAAGKPEGICVLLDSRIAVADTHYHRVVFFSRDGKLLNCIGREGTGPGEFMYPVSVVQDPEGNIYVGEYGTNDRIQKFTSKGDCICSFGGFGTDPGMFQRLAGIAWAHGKIYAADAINNRIQVFRDDGTFIGILGQGKVRLNMPYDVAFGKEHLYAVEYSGGCIKEITPEGVCTGRFGSPGTGFGSLRTPWGLTVCADGTVLIADTGNRRIVKLKL